MSYSHINIHKNYVNKIDVINLNNVKKKRRCREKKIFFDIQKFYLRYIKPFTLYAFHITTHNNEPNFVVPLNIMCSILEKDEKKSH